MKKSGAAWEGAAYEGAARGRCGEAPQLGGWRERGSAITGDGHVDMFALSDAHELDHDVRRDRRTFRRGDKRFQESESWPNRCAPGGWGVGQCVRNPGQRQVEPFDNALDWCVVTLLGHILMICQQGSEWLVWCYLLWRGRSTAARRDSPPVHSSMPAGCVSGYQFPSPVPEWCAVVWRARPCSRHHGEARGRRVPRCRWLRRVAPPS